MSVLVKKLVRRHRGVYHECPNCGQDTEYVEVGYEIVREPDKKFIRFELSHEECVQCGDDSW